MKAVKTAQRSFIRLCVNGGIFMNKRVRFTRWRIGLKTLKWWGVLCVIVYPLSALLQRYVFHFQYPKDALGYALLTVTFLGPIIAGIFFLLEETVDSIDGQKLQKRENIVCSVSVIAFLLFTFTLKCLDISI